MLKRVTRSIGLPLLVLLMLAIPTAALASVLISITVAPPPLPVYVQPPCVESGYMWAPGYWAWGDEGYFWVPGTWVAAPSVGMLWTPGYWGWGNGVYLWNAGYWGTQVGFYGGINYGFGYGGSGFVGGEWRGNGFFYNTAVMNVSSAHVTNVYVNRSVIVNTGRNVSYNGGAGGTTNTATAAERTAAREPHVQPTAMQAQHQTAASNNTQMLAKNNAGKPAIAATARSGDFSAGSAVAAKSAGGRVEPATMNASAKSMPAPRAAAAPAHAPAPLARPATQAAPVDHRETPAVQRPSAASNIPRSLPTKPSTPPVTEARRPSPPSAPAPRPVLAPREAPKPAAHISTPQPAPRPAAAPREAPRPAAHINTPQPAPKPAAAPREAPKPPAHVSPPKPPEKKGGDQK